MKYCVDKFCNHPQYSTPDGISDIDWLFWEVCVYQQYPRVDSFSFFPMTLCLDYLWWLWSSLASIFYFSPLLFHPILQLQNNSPWASLLFVIPIFKNSWWFLLLPTKILSLACKPYQCGPSLLFSLTSSYSFLYQWNWSISHSRICLMFLFKL